MEKESFENTEVAKILNENYVSIKLDREERPDIDHIYMEICTALTGSGGWPLSIIMDFEQRPFYAGTYFPKEKFLTILNYINDIWKNDRNSIKNTTKEIFNYFNTQHENNEKIKDDIFQKTFLELKTAFDKENGGFGHAPKFPSPHNLLFLIEYSKQEKCAMDMAKLTLEKMHRGGIYDHIGKGFFRYSTDKIWLVPHFEKMLYDNALLAYSYAFAKDEYFTQISMEILDYLLTVMRSEEGGFYCAEDADSEGVEGKFYLFEKAEVDLVLGNDSKKFCRLYDISESGNFEGRNIPNLISDPLPSDMTEFVQSCKRKLFETREGRIHPFLDKKIITGLNGLAISAFAFAGKTAARQDYIETAKTAVDFIEKTLKNKNGKLLSRYCGGQADFSANADDYAFYIWGLLELFYATRELCYLSKALEYQNTFTEEFWDDENGGFHYTSKNAEKLLTNPKPVYDGAIPSANSAAAMNIVRLYRLTGDNKFFDLIEKLLDTFSSKINTGKSAYSYFLLAYYKHRQNFKKAILVAEKRDYFVEIEKLISQHENIVIITNEAPIDKNILDYYKGYETLNNRPTAYICRDKSCLAPINDITKIKEELNNFY